MAVKRTVSPMTRQ
jgi:hypothetical protein